VKLYRAPTKRVSNCVYRLHNVSTTGVDSRGPGRTPVDNEAAEKARSIKHLGQKRNAINQLAGRAS